MPNLLNIAKKLKGRSRQEIAGRARQALSTIAERKGLLSEAKLPTNRRLFALLSDSGIRPDLRDVAQYFRHRTDRLSFGGLVNPEITASAIKSRYPNQYISSIQSDAEKILTGKFDLLGLHDLEFGNPVDWHREPKSGKRTSLEHWSRIEFLDPAVAGDKKITWELNRHQYLLKLARAWLYTGDDRFAECFVRHLKDWMQANPPKRGINWASSLEIAFRSISWIWSLEMFRDSPFVSDELWISALKFLYVNARHLEAHLSTWFSPNTHLTGEALGLYYIGSAFPEFRRSRHWKQLGAMILVDQLDRQVLPDGVYFERSTWYHRYTIDFYTHFLLLAQNDRNVPGEKTRAVLARMAEHLMYLVRPDSTVPLIGDDDGGRLMFLANHHPSDFTSALSNAAVMFERADFKFVARELSEETVWLFGSNATGKFDQMAPREPESTSKGFPDGGYYVMRDGWSNDANYLLVDGGPHGALSCGHAHADALAIDLAANGTTFLADPGTFTYTGSSEERNLFRSALYHSTVSVNLAGLSKPSESAFSWDRTADAGMSRWITESRFDLFEGEVQGFAEREQSAVKHTRSIFFLKRQYWVICDHLSSNARQDYASSFHFAPGINLNINRAGEGSVVSAESNGRMLRIAFTSDVASTGPAATSGCYGEKQASKYATVYRREKICQISTALFPGFRGSETNSLITEFDREIEIRFGQWIDVIAFNPASTNSETRIVSDFAFVWLRTDRETAEILDLIAVGGRKLTFDGIPVVDSSRVIRLAEAGNDGSEVKFVFDDGTTATLAHALRQSASRDKVEVELCAE